MAVIWRTKENEKIYVTPSGWPLTKQAHKLADDLDNILISKIENLKNELKQEGYFDIKNDLEKYYLLGKKLHFLDDIELLSKCDPDRENIWRALYDYVPDLAPNILPKEKARTTGKRNFFLCCYKLGKLNKKTRNRIGSWSNWQEVYLVFSGNPRLWEDWERLLEWILSRTEKKGAMTKSNIRDILTILRKSIGKRAKIKRDTTVLTIDELYKLLDAN